MNLEAVKTINQQQLLTQIIASNPGIQVVCPNMPELVRQVYRGTGIHIRTAHVFDQYETEVYNEWYGEWETRSRKRKNNREFTLTINQ